MLMMLCQQYLLGSKPLQPHSVPYHDPPIHLSGCSHRDHLFGHKKYAWLGLEIDDSHSLTVSVIQMGYMPSLSSSGSACRTNSYSLCGGTKPPPPPVTVERNTCTRISISVYVIQFWSYQNANVKCPGGLLITEEILIYSLISQKMSSVCSWSPFFSVPFAPTFLLLNSLILLLV